MVSDRSQFEATCFRVAQAARNAGVTLEKAPKSHELIVARAGREQRFPIVSDPRDWKRTSVEEAFFAVVNDSLAWVAARPDAFTDRSDPAAVPELPMVAAQRSDHLVRVKVLAELLGGESQLRNLWLTAGADEQVAASVPLV
jgi:hypothetical protein